jgi:hypothetical protein
MNKYILIGSVSGIGGWQLYTEARYNYLKNDCDVYIVSPSINAMQLSGFEEEKILIVPEIFMPTYVYTKKQIFRIIKKIGKTINIDKSDGLFIEATTIAATMWGELLAKTYGGVCYSYILQSHIDCLSKEEKKFLKFKYDNNLLSGMATQTIPEIFKDFYDPQGDVRFLSASWESPLSDTKKQIEFLESLKNDADTKIIGYFGNLAKPHFKKLCEFVRSYCDNRPDRKFVFLSIGSSNDKSSEEVQYKSCKLNNCISYNIPSVYPVPHTYFEYMDVCIASWGCSVVAARAGVSTIRLIDDVDIKPQGIMGVTIIKMPFNDIPPCSESLEMLLDNILIENKYQNIEFVFPNTDNKARQKKISDTLKPFVRDAQSIGYYDVFNIKCCGGRKNNLIKLMNNAFGISITNKIVKLIKILKSMMKK